MKKHLLSTSLLAIVAIPSLAGQVTFTGTGRVASKPDYVELTLSVNSECYKTPTAARIQTDNRVKRIVALLDTKIRHDESSRDAVLTSGGYSSPYSKTHYNQDGTRKAVCEGTFQKSTTITLKTTNVDGFAADFDDIQEQVLAEFRAPDATDEEQPITYVSIGTPQAQLFHETMAAAENAAFALALRDAISKLEATFGACPITNYDIASYTDASETAREMSYAAERSMGNAPTPVNFDDLWTRRTLKVNFNFEGGHCFMSKR